jgi:tripartite-type tricarboxylate transporter receptor subunit TctC
MGSSRPPVTPAEILDKLRRAPVSLLTSAELKKQFDSQNAVPSPTASPEFAAFLMAEQAKWGAGRARDRRQARIGGPPLDQAA